MTWSQSAIIVSPGVSHGAGPGSCFGARLALSGSTLAISTKPPTGNATTYVYSYEGAGWSVQQVLKSPHLLNQNRWVQALDESLGVSPPPSSSWLSIVYIPLRSELNHTLSFCCPIHAAIWYTKSAYSFYDHLILTYKVFLYLDRSY